MAILLQCLLNGIAIKFEKENPKNKWILICLFPNVDIFLNAAFFFFSTEKAV
jgi:hypothetical protein